MKLLTFQIIYLRKPREIKTSFVTANQPFTKQCKRHLRIGWWRLKKNSKQEPKNEFEQNDSNYLLKLSPPTEIQMAVGGAKWRRGNRVVFSPPTKRTGQGELVGVIRPPRPPTPHCQPPVPL